MSKRTRFVIISLVLAFLLWLSTMVSVEWRFALVLSVFMVTYVLSVWVLFDDLKGIEWFTLMVLPTMFALGSGLFANFLPNSIPRFFGKIFQVETAILLSGMLRVLYFLLVSVGLYGILLIENIFSVASIRTIQLFRAARSVNFILTLLTALFFYTTIFGLKLPFYWIGLMSFIVTTTLSFPSLWSVDLKTIDFRPLWRMSSSVGLVLLVMSLALSFWPIKPFMAGLIFLLSTHALKVQWFISSGMRSRKV